MVLAPYMTVYSMKSQPYCIYVPYMTVYSIKFQPKIPYIYIWFWLTLHIFGDSQNQSEICLPLWNLLYGCRKSTTSPLHHAQS